MPFTAAAVLVRARRDYIFGRETRETASSLDWRADDAYLVGVGPQDANGNRGVVRIAADGSEVLSLTPASVKGHGLASVDWLP